MATVVLDTVWLALASAPGTAVQLDVTELSDDDPVVGEVRVMASGRLRSVRGAARPASVRVSADVTRAQLATLRSWVGQVVLLRDPFGRKEYGVYYSLPASERVPVDFPSVEFTLQRVTFSEAVV